MIQRIQTIYLTVAAVLLGFCALSVNSVGGAEPIATAAILIAGLLAVISVIAIFMYGQRGRQKKVVRWLGIGSILLVIALGLWILGDGRYDALAANDLLDGAFAGVGSAVVGGLLLFLARRSIEKDIELVKSMDRIR